jgi:heavy metal sensor kinase
VLTLGSIRLRLTLWYILLLALILAAFSAGIYLTLRHSLSTSLDDSLEVRGEELLLSVHFEGDVPTLAEAVPEDGPADGEQFARVFDASGAVTFDNGAPPGAPAAIQAVLDGNSVTRSFDVRGGKFRSRLIPIRRDSEVGGVLEVARSEDDIRDTLRTLLLILGISYPAALVVASFGGVFLAGRALSPVDRLTQMARRISAEDLGKRLDLQLPDDEVGRLARTFDEMIARLDEAFARQRQFTADASHELRTPLTAMKGQVEVALSKPRDVAAYQQVLQAVNEDVDRMIRLVGSLLTLARADAGQLPLARESIDVRSLVASAVEQVRPLAEERRIALNTEPGSQLHVAVDEDLMLQLLLNLLDNAIKYTPTGGQVTLDWDAKNGQVELSVHDTGPGIGSEDLPHVFDRFYRVDKARSRAEGGAGLGLAISRWIAQAHRGDIVVRSTPGQGATFTVRLPIGN